MAGTMEIEADYEEQNFNPGLAGHPLHKRVKRWAHQTNFNPTINVSQI